MLQRNKSRQFSMQVFQIYGFVWNMRHASLYLRIPVCDAHREKYTGSGWLIYWVRKWLNLYPLTFTHFHTCWVTHYESVRDSRCGKPSQFRKWTHFYALLFARFTHFHTYCLKMFESVFISPIKAHSRRKTKQNESNRQSLFSLRDLLQCRGIE